MIVTMLGCGPSAGVPFIGCECVVCSSNNPKNNRTRASLLVEITGKNLLIDSSPDLRQQALREKITRIDAVLYTHAHADHTNGLDELRSFNYLSKEVIPIYGDANSLSEIEARFSYAFGEPPENIWYRPALASHIAVDKPVGEFELFDTKIAYFEQQHGRSKSYGYRIGNFAYSTDCDGLNDAAFKALSGIDTWIVDCLSYTPSYSHAHLELTLDWIKRLNPKRAILTHMNHDLGYEICDQLPGNVELGYDGLKFSL